MPDLFDLLQRRFRSLIGGLLFVWPLTGGVLFFIPEQYKSETTSIASSVVASDPSRLFGSQVQHLYSPLGSPDQLDLLVGSGRLDTVYRPLVRRFDLIDHYALSGSGPKAFLKAVKKLKKNTDVFKSDYGELKVRVWDTDANLAAALANALTDRLDSMHRDVMSRQNQQTLSALQRGLLRLELSKDSITALDLTKYRSLYQNLIEEYTLLLEQRPPAIQVLDSAVAAALADKPDWVMTVVAVTIVTVLLWLIFSLWSERRHSNEHRPS
ncbi:MAG: hypothetical protein ACKO6Q_07710 [Bacteroidota bacterium]